MSNVILAPSAIVDYRGAVQIEFKYDDIIIGCTQAADVPINIIECPIDTLITLQCVDNAMKPIGPVWVYADGEWGTYHASVHQIPQTLVDDGAEDPEDFIVSHSPLVEILRAENAPSSHDAPEDDDDDEDDKD